MSETFDILVLGGGPAGYSSAIQAARLLKPYGGAVALVEAGELGGACLNRGCIPTKTLIETAGFLDAAAAAAQRGIVLSGTVSVDIPKAFQYKNRVVKKMTAGVGALLRENGVRQFTGVASLEGGGWEVVGGASEKTTSHQPPTTDHHPFMVMVKNGDSVETCLARKVILATGSVPTRISVPGMDDPAVAGRILDSDDLLDADQMPGGLPERLAILGGGVIGIEMARIFKAFGVDVHIVEALPRLAPFLDTEISEALTKSLKSKKIKVSVGTKLRRLEPVETGLRLLLDSGDFIDATHLLVAVGRSPKTDMLSEELLQELQPDPRGFLPVDWFLRTKVPGLFAPGDVNGKCMLAHAAIDMGHRAAETAAAELFPDENETDEIPESDIEEYRRRIMEKGTSPMLPNESVEAMPYHVPGCIYGEPEVGYIGLTEDGARKLLGDRIAVGRFPFIANGRAASAGHRDGFVKVIRLKDDDRIVGVHIVGPCAAELINEASTVMHLGGSVEQWIGAIHAHPTYGEALVEAAADSMGAALHLPPRESATAGRGLE